MVEQDTVRLLRECDAGAKMGMDALTDVLGKVRDGELKHLLSVSKQSHEQLSEEIQRRLHELDDAGKPPSPIASGMAWLKTHAELALDGSDQTIADLMTDGCNMGVKSLSKYLNQYKAADERSKSFAQRLIGMEETLTQQIRPYL